MKKYKCPCCGFFTFEGASEEDLLFDYCEVCLWQYDPVVHDKPDTLIGANHISLNQARENYKQFGVCKPENKSKVREPLEEELPKNNLE